MPSGRHRVPVTSKPDVTARLIGVFKQLISEGALTPGARLPAERELALMLGVARSSLRQALKVLEVIGVISQRVGDGTYLNDTASTVLREPLEFLMLLDGITPQEVMEARLIVEPELAARAAARATAVDIAAIGDHLTAMQEHEGNRPQVVEADLLFHQSVFRAAGNRLCTLMFTVVHRSMRDLMETTSQLVGPQHTINLHKRIYSAIRRREPETARLRMTEHLQDAHSLLVRATDQHQQSRLEQRLGHLSK
jgi:GntR family transcriptional regulator, transcriptional repressor for pyruvate dehydrogenase complex